MNGKGKVLILGAGGGVGGEMAQALIKDGWHVRGMRRSAGRDVGDSHIEWVLGDAMRREDVLGAAKGVDVIVHAVNPPGYRGWSQLVLPMIENTIAAAQGSGALIMLPGTVYNYGPDELPEPSESAPQRPVTKKGQLRVRMEAALERHVSAGGRALIVRAGDFFGPRAGNNWFSQGLVRVGEPVRKVYAPGTPGIGHQWCYLPDFAQTIVELLNRRSDLEPFARFHFGGHWDSDGTMMTESIRRAVSKVSGRAPKTRAFPWPLIALASPFVETFREMREMRYLWRRPLKLRNDKLLAFLGFEPHTPWDQAVRESLEGIGSI